MRQWGIWNSECCYIYVLCQIVNIYCCIWGSIRVYYRVWVTRRVRNTHAGVGMEQNPYPSAGAGADLTWWVRVWVASTHWVFTRCHPWFAVWLRWRWRWWSLSDGSSPSSTVIILCTVVTRHRWWPPQPRREISWCSPHVNASTSPIETPRSVPLSHPLEHLLTVNFLQPSHEFTFNVGIDLLF
jgi:hypothetical protein